MSCSDWKEAALGEVGTIIGGGTPSTKIKDYYGGGISWITPKDLSTYSERYIYKGQKMITEKGLAGSSAKMMPENTVLFSSRAPIGYIALAGNELCTNQGFKNIIPKPDIVHFMFLYYLLKNKKIDIEAVASGTTFLEVSGTNLKNFKVNLPSLPEQKAIASTLSCLDDKIELNNRINKNLEEMAQAIFKSWFVDFEPFQDGEFEDSELGRIPKGWRVKKLKDISEFQNGYAFYKIGYSEEGAMVIDLGNVDLLGSFKRTNADKFISIELYEQGKMEKFRVLKNDLVMIMTDRKATMDLLGKTAKITEDNYYILNQRVGRIRANKDINVNFLHTYLNNNSFLNELKKKALGSVQKYVNTNHIKDSLMLVPNDEVMLSFGQKVDPIFDEIANLNLQNVYFDKIRDTLLPKLMSGEIRVPIKEVQ